MSVEPRNLRGILRINIDKENDEEISRRTLSGTAFTGFFSIKNSSSCSKEQQDFLIRLPLTLQRVYVGYEDLKKEEYRVLCDTYPHLHQYLLLNIPFKDLHLYKDRKLNERQITFLNKLLQQKHKEMYLGFILSDNEKGFIYYYMPALKVYQSRFTPDVEDIIFERWTLFKLSDADVNFLAICPTEDLSVEDIDFMKNLTDKNRISYFKSSAEERKGYRKKPYLALYAKYGMLFENTEQYTPLSEVEISALRHLTLHISLKFEEAWDIVKNKNVQLFIHNVRASHSIYSDISYNAGLVFLNAYIDGKFSWGDIDRLILWFLNGVITLEDVEILRDSNFNQHYINLSPEKREPFREYL